MNDSPKIAVFGAGAVGAYVGGWLSRSGLDVTLVDPWPEHVERMRENGLDLSGLTDEECFNTPVRAMHLTELQSLARGSGVDVAFVCVKSYDTAWTTQLAKEYLSPGGFVVSLQNCMNEETIAGIVGWGRVVGCIASSISVELSGPATVRRMVPKGGEAHTVFRVGEPHGRSTPRVERIAEWLSAIDSAKVTTNLWGERWSKLVLNAMGNGVSAASGMTTAAMTMEPVTRRLSIRLAGEAIRVGLAHGFVLEKIRGLDSEEWIRIDDGDEQLLAELEARMIDAASKRAADGRPSMGQDALKGRRTEIDALNGLVVAKGAEAGIPTPANEGLVAAVKRMERGEAEASLANVAGI